MQRQVPKIYEDRPKMAAGGMPINWGFAENLAYATLLFEGHPVRLTGQDVGRGTFSHRHAVLHNQKDDSVYIPLAHLFDGQPRVSLYDSFLSEEAVLAFEYGYATTTPNSLVIWEAQFGDFANGAQVVIDQFITSGESKWGRLCGLTMLLPHGYEGQGPEHSSARLERYLQLCAEQNMQVCVPTTPAQVYHMLRRQVIRPLRKPLIVMTPKSLLRHKLAISTLEDLANGSFQTVIPEIDSLDPKKVDRVVLCSGKVYYDLLEKRRAEGREEHRDRPYRAAVSVPGRRSGRGAGAVQEPQAHRLVPGRAAEPGRLVLLPAPHASCHRRAQEGPQPGVRGPRRLGCSGLRLRFDARRAAGKTAAGRLHRLTPTRS